jgi:hypothetical protein
VYDMISKIREVACQEDRPRGQQLYGPISLGMELKRVFSHKKLYPAKEHTKVVNKKKTP